METDYRGEDLMNTEQFISQYNGNRYFQTIRKQLDTSKSLVLYCQQQEDFESGKKFIDVFEKATRQIAIYFMTEALSRPMVTAKYVPCRRLGQWMSMQGIERWEGFFEKDGI